VGNGSGIDGQIIMPQRNFAAAPTLAFGDGDTGFHEIADDTVRFAAAGTNVFSMNASGIQMENGPNYRNEIASATNPVFVPGASDLDTGIGTAAVDQLSLISGGVEGLRLTEANSGVLQVPSAAVTVTAFAGGGQGSATALIHSYNVITVVATAGDSVRLPDVFAINSLIYIKNDDAADAADVFPASGDDLGAGVNTAVSLPAGQSLTFIATVADSTWTLVITGGAGGAGVSGEFDNLLLSQSPGSHAASPTLRFGDGDSGFYESVDDVIVVSVAGVARYTFGVFAILSTTGGSFGLQDVVSTAILPTLTPNGQDPDTGIGHADSDELSMTAGGVEGLRLTEISSGIIQAPNAQLAITAFAGGGQGSAVPIVSSYAVVTVVATAADSVRLPDVFAVNSLVTIKNDDSTDACDVFPASGDDLGAGTDTAESLAAGASITYIATVADSTWTDI